MDLVEASVQTSVWQPRDGFKNWKNDVNRSRLSAGGVHIVLACRVKRPVHVRHRMT